MMRYEACLPRRRRQPKTSLGGQSRRIEEKPEESERSETRSRTSGPLCQWPLSFPHSSHTDNLHARLATHNAKQVLHTSKFAPWEIHSAIAEEQAECLEHHLKTHSGKDWDSMGVTFVVRLRRDIKFRRTEAIEQPDDREQDILVDEVIRLTGDDTERQYPHPLRRVVVYRPYGSTRHKAGERRGEDEPPPEHTIELGTNNGT